MTTTHDSPGWTLFTYISFGTSILMMGVGIFLLESSPWMKGYLAMAAVMMLNASITLAKTVRDNHEQKKFHNRVEDAKTEKLLKEYNVAA